MKRKLVPLQQRCLECRVAGTQLILNCVVSSALLLGVLVVDGASGPPAGDVRSRSFTLCRHMVEAIAIANLHDTNVSLGWQGFRTSQIADLFHL